MKSQQAFLGGFPCESFINADIMRVDSISTNSKYRSNGRENNLSNIALYFCQHRFMCL